MTQDRDLSKPGWRESEKMRAREEARKERDQLREQREKERKNRELQRKLKELERQGRETNGSGSRPRLSESLLSHSKRNPARSEVCLVCFVGAVGNQAWMCMFV